MANDEHVALLKQGVEAWNAWRDENPGIRPDLSKANLSYANLRGANLRGADLTKANLSKANLAGASLVRARLSATTMTGQEFMEPRSGTSRQTIKLNRRD